MPLASSALALASSNALSKLIARSICGSPKTLPKPKTSRPARRPTSIPRMRSVLTMRRTPGSMTREPEQVASVMHELVHIHAGDDRRGTFLGTHKIDREQRQRREDGPWQAQGSPHSYRHLLW